MTIDNLDRAAIVLVTEYLMERHAWERDSWAMWRRARKAETLDPINADLLRSSSVSPDDVDGSR